jgi:hypothetical protein
MIINPAPALKPAKESEQSNGYSTTIASSTYSVDL